MTRALTPIFIGGAPRSGTTWLGALLGRDRQTVCLPEAPFFHDETLAERSLYGPAAVSALSRIRAGREFLAWRELGAYQAPNLPPGRGAFADFAGDLVHQYAAHAGKSAPAAFVDHTPQNILYTGVLMRRFPGARFIHIIRDGRAVAASVLPLDFGPDDVITAARLWVDMVGAGLAAAHMMPDRVLTVRYEDLTREPDAALRRVQSFCGLPEAGLDRGGPSGPGFRVPWHNRAIHALVDQAPDPGRNEAWRANLSASQVRVFEYFAGHLLRALTYDLVNTPPFRGPSRARQAAIALGGSLRRLVHRKAEKQVFEAFAASVAARDKGQPCPNAGRAAPSRAPLNTRWPFSL